MLTRDQKAQQIDWIKQQLAMGKPAVYVGYRGVKIIELDKLRHAIDGIGGQVKVVKTRLLKLALSSANALPADMWDKPVALVIGSEDPIALSKVVDQFIKDHEVVELFGGLVDQATVGQSVIRQLAILPGRDELLAKLVGSLAAPLRRLAWGLRWNQYALISILKQYYAAKVS